MFGCSDGNLAQKVAFLCPGVQLTCDRASDVMVPLDHQLGQGISEAHLGVCLRGCFQRRLTGVGEGQIFTLSVCSSISAGQDRIKRGREKRANCVSWLTEMWTASCASPVTDLSPQTVNQS